MMREVRTEIEIDSSAARVWQTLTDFVAYPQWNPFVRKIKGEARAGARLRVRVRYPGGLWLFFSATVLKADPCRELRWRGRLLLPGLFQGEHVFTLESLGNDRTRLRQCEVFTGLLVPVMMFFLGASTRRGFAAMNEALKARAEHAPVH